MATEALMDIFGSLVLQVAIVGFLATVAEAIVEGFIAPVFDRYEKMKPHKFWLMYAAWGVSFVLVLLSGVNLFAEFIPDYAMVGRVLTAIVAGRGSNFLHDLFSARRASARADRLIAGLTEPCDCSDADAPMQFEWEGIGKEIEE